MPTLSQRASVLLVALVAAVAVSVVLFYVFRSRTLLDTGPLDLPGIPEARDDGEEVLLAVADIGFCGHEADDRVAELAARLPGRIAVMGDLVYPEATAENLRGCFQPSWGPLLDRIRPVLGNHDYVSLSADAYFDFFGARAGQRDQGWYSYDLGAWHVVALNSNCQVPETGGCAPGSPQYGWLQQDLAANSSDCLLAYWHHPVLSSGRYGGYAPVEPLWDLLVERGVDVTLHGHVHSYERLAIEGVDAFVVGTGGRSLYLFERGPLPETRARNDRNYGLLYLVLGDGTYDWEFLPLGASAFTDSGSGEC